jgi:hypothetical protein
VAGIAATITPVIALLIYYVSEPSLT